MKVIYYGLPHLFCENEHCNCMFGFWADLTQFLPFNGYLMIYESGYFKELWHWLKTGEWGEE